MIHVPPVVGEIIRKASGNIGPAAFFLAAHATLR